MAASMEKFHERRNVCSNRPLYRDGRKDRAVKVFTINQESRYLLVQGVPDIKITDELLKLFSLYGTIEEYRILDELPCEEFTKNYWIKYADIQAARVAKRKMDDHSFYGGFLHVTYAPEYESIQDTREKLQQRRMAVARRLRKLTLDKSEENAEEEGIETIPASSGTIPPEAPHPPVPSVAWGSHLDVSTNLSAASQVEASAGRSNGPAGSGDPLAPGSEAALFPSLPAPPRKLPPWQWDIPSQPEFPRRRTAHDTLPAGFDPFPARDEDPRCHNLGDQSSQRRLLPPPPAPCLAPPGTFIGPRPPSDRYSTGEPHPGIGSPAEPRSDAGERTRRLEPGARLKARTDGKVSEGHGHASQSSPSMQDPHLGMESNDILSKRPVDETVSGTRWHEGRTGLGPSDGGMPLCGEARPKLVPRRRLGPQSTSPKVQPSARSGDIEAHRSSQAGHPQFVPRVVSTRTKRSASSIEEVDDHQMTSLPITGNASFDQTVNVIRQHMSQASSASLPASQLDSAIVQLRNQERMGTLPRRPPVKRQRI